MDIFENIQRNLDRVAALQAQSAKESAERHARHEAEMAEWKAEERERRVRLEKEMDEWRAEERDRWARIDKRLEESERKLDSISKQLGGIGMNNGAYFEEIIYSSLYEKRKLGGLYYEKIARNVFDINGDTEYDILMINGEAVAIIEVKYRAHPNDIEKFLAKKPVVFRRGFPGLKDHRLYLGIASGSTYKVLIEEAKNAGIFLLGPKGDSHEVLNAEVRAF